MTAETGDQGHDATGTGDAGSRLDRRRMKAAEAHRRLEEGRGRLEKLDARLGETAARQGRDEAALRAAQDEVKRLKHTLADGAKERKKLQTLRKQAAAEVAKAERKVRSTEARYDEAVLAELVRREKDNDRRALPAGTGGDETTAAAGDGDVTSAGDGASASGSGDAPGPEGEDLATATSRETAARVTAEAAEDAAHTTPDSPGTDAATDAATDAGAGEDLRTNDHIRT